MNTISDPIETEVLIIGSGIAGCSAALKLAEAGFDVTMITRAADPHDSNTFRAQGGIIFKGEDDSPELLTSDILRVGAGMSHLPAAELLAHEGPKLVQEILLDKAAVPFSRTPDGALERILEGGHSTSRILHAFDTTGKAIETSLIKLVSKHPKIRLLTQFTATDLLTPSHHSPDKRSVYVPPSCVGAYLLDRKEGLVKRCFAKKTILATGGLGQIFLRTTNGPGARGDGLAMAYRAGARVINCEFVQFHPTTLYARGSTQTLISEAVRGAGARLVHSDGEPFMQKYDAEWKDLAPRDVVARSIHREMLERDTTNVYLDLRSYIPKDRILEKFPSINQSCLAFGIDITKDLVPVVPAAHYFCGGVWADLWGKTSLEHLYAVGEVSCTGLHGANRLASTSLLECLVWGNRAAQAITKELAKGSAASDRSIPPWQPEGTAEADPALISQDMSSIKTIMWNYVGLVRTTERLERAIRDLQSLENAIIRFYRVSRLNDSLLGLRNAVRSAMIVTLAAWENRTSAGCHYRE